jgi:repressor LexA
MAQKLTPTERRVLDVVCGTVRSVGRPPSIAQIMELAKLPSRARVHFHLDNLQRKGLIRRDTVRPRVIRVDCDAVEARPAGPVDAASREGARGEPAAGQVRPEPTEESAATGETAGGVVFGRGPRHEGTDPTLVSVPLLGRVAAGYPSDPPPDEVEATYQLPRALVGNQDPLFMVRVSGASMLGEGIHQGDLLVVHRRRTAEVGETVVVLEGSDAAAVKSLWRSDDGRVELRSANPDFGPLKVPEARIIGRVVTVIRTL